MVDSSQRGANSEGKPLPEALEEYIRAKQKAAGSGNYANDVRLVLEKWVGFCQERGVETADSVSDRVLKSYAEHLHRRVDARVSSDGDDGISGRTAHQYYALVRAFLAYCEEWDWIDENPAAKQRVTDELPEESLGAAESDTQTWSVEERRQLVDYVDRRAREAIDDRGIEAEAEARDRAIVYLLAYSGARSAELFRDPQDDRREALRWSDIDFEGNTIAVLGKSQDDESVQFPALAHDALKQYRRVIQPPTEDWPVFPTRHAPTLHQLADDIDADRDDQDPLPFLRAHGVSPPSITTQSVRNTLRRLCDDGDVDVKGDHDYLKPHGARRGVGKQLYKEAGHEAAQKALRHDDPETTSKMYADIKAGEVAEIADDVFQDE